MTGLSTRYNSLMQNMDYVFGSGLFNAGGGSDGESTVLDIGILQSRERMLDGDLIFDWRIGYNISENVTVSLIIDNLFRPVSFNSFSLYVIYAYPRFDDRPTLPLS